MTGMQMNILLANAWAITAVATGRLLLMVTSGIFLALALLLTILEAHRWAKR